MMNVHHNFFSMGNFRTALKGKKTYIVAAFMVAIGVVNFLTGDLSFLEFVASPDVQLILEGLGISALRAGVSSR